MWVQELGFLEPAAQVSLPEKDTYPVKVTSIDSVYGKLSFLAPPLSFSNLVLPKKSDLTPYGADTPHWGIRWRRAWPNRTDHLILAKYNNLQPILPVSDFVVDFVRI